MRVLLTGATGLIGCHTAAALAGAGFEVKALVRDASKLDAVLAPFDLRAGQVVAVIGDVTDRESVELALDGCDALIHCAGRFSHELSEADALRCVNVDGTEAVLGAAVERGLDPIVHISSMLALLPPRGETLTAEDPIGSANAMYSRTKAEADRIARHHQEQGAPVTIVYPGSVQGPYDPTLGSGPELFARYLRTGRVLVTDGGLDYSDVRDVALLLAKLMEPGRGPRRIMAPADFIEHDRFHRLLCDLTDRELKTDRMPALLLRVVGRFGDLKQRLTGKPAQLTSEAAMVLTRSVPFADADARALLGDEAHCPEDSFRDLLRWMYETGVLDAEHVGQLADAAER